MTEVAPLGGIRMEWIVDLVGPGVAQAMQVDAILYDGRSAFQRIQVAASRLFGRMLVLDDAIQTTERDEYTYHEMLVHLPLVTHPSPRRALIIGGGDGGDAGRVSQTPSPEGDHGRDRPGRRRGVPALPARHQRRGI